MMILGEMRLFVGDIPDGWLPCEGQKLSVDDYAGFYGAIGTTYGGDGVESFDLPDLRGRTLAGISTTMNLGMAAGAVTVSLTNDRMPSYSHPMLGSGGVGSQASPVGGVWALSLKVNGYSTASNGGQMAADAISTAGDGEGHSNMQPYLALR